MELIGCSIEFLIKHLSIQFTQGMSWANYGKYGWEVDHITPLSHFDLTDPVQLEKAAHFSNLQPLWQKENCSKGNRQKEDLESEIKNSL